MNAQRALIIGGTGMLGLPVAKRLQSDGFDVTLMSSHPDAAREKLGGRFRIVEGDVTEPDSLRRAIERHQFVHINLNARLDPELYRRIEIDGTANVANVAREMGVLRVSNISGASSQGIAEGPIYVRAKVEAEQAIIDSGVPYSIMRPSWTFETLPFFIQQGRAAVLGKQPHPRHWLAADDLAAQVSRAYQTEVAANRCFYKFGPQLMTMMAALKIFCARVQPEITPECVSFGKAKMVAMIPSMSELKKAIPFFEFFNDLKEDIDSSETDRILGSNLTTLEEWLEKHYPR